MAKLKDDLLKKEAWSDLIMGNHAVARGMLEAGVQVATTYPGSPTPEIAAALSSIPGDQRPFYFEYSLNEKVALEVATGASLNGHLATVFFKSVGLNVAADSLIQLSLMEMIGGMVVILGDDPGANSSQNEQDNRHFARMSYIPMFEPATPTEAYEMYLEAARLSKRYRAPVFMRMTTHVCHAKEVVSFGQLPGEEADWTPRFDPENGPYIPIVNLVFPLKRRALKKLGLFEEEAEKSAFNRTVTQRTEKTGSASRGVIASAIPTLAVLENLEEVEESIDVLKLGFSYPLPRKKIAEFLRAHDEVVIVEELDRVLENEVKALAWDEKLSTTILTRTDSEQLMGELTPDRTWALLSEFWPEIFLPRDFVVAGEKQVARRLAQMCPGCGHRSAYHAVRAAIDDDTVTVGDIGCHSLGFFPPYEIGKVLLSMGHSTATGAGLAIQSPKKVVCFLGDSTLFHAGWPGIVNAIVNGHDITLILMENGTTAMTGHQPRPGSGEIGDKIPIKGVFESFGVKFIREVDTYNQARLTEHIKEAMEFSGFSVVIAKHPCMLKFVRTQRSKVPGFKMSAVSIDQAKCDRSAVCVEQFGCPSFMTHDDGTVTVHPDLCIGDGSCLGTCPAQAIVRQKTGGE